MTDSCHTTGSPVELALRDGPKNVCDWRQSNCVFLTNSINKMHMDLLVQLLVKGAVGGVGLALKHNQRKSEAKKQQKDFLTTKLVQSVTCFQQGLELLTEYLQLNNIESSTNCGDKEWRNLIKEVTKAPNMADYIQSVPLVCFSLGEVVPFLCLIKDKVDPGNPAFISAKEAFQCLSLLASVVFQSTEVTSFNHLLFYSIATAMRVNATIMQYFSTPELSATVVIGYIEQLTMYSRNWVEKVRRAKGLNKLLLMKCLHRLLALAARLLNLNLNPEARVQLKEDLRACQTSGLFSLISQYCLIAQTPFGQQGVNDEEFDGPTSIAVNSEGLVIVADSRNQKIKALTATGKVLWVCDPLPEDASGKVPLIISTNQHDEIFTVFYKESTRKTTIVKFDPNGRFMCSFDTRYCFGDLGQNVIPCGMSVSSRGFVYLGDEGNGRIYILEQDGVSLSPRNVIRIRDFGSHFSFCLGPNDNLIVATRTRVVIFHEDGKELKKVALNWHKASKVKQWKPLAVAYDANLKHVLVVTAGDHEIARTSCFSSKTLHLKPMMWFISTESYALVNTVEFPLRDIDDTHGRFDMAAGGNGLWCVTEATHRIHCFTMMYHVIKP